MSAIAGKFADTFAANRAVGEIALTVAGSGEASRRTSTHEAGPLRVRFPAAAPGLEAVIVNSAGGAAGGDRFAIEIVVEAGARLAVTTASAEKIYRSLGPDTRIDVTLRVGAGGALAWLPQETILFDRARLVRSINVELAEGASLILAEALVFGRTAMGERIEEGRLRDRWRVRRGGKLVFAESVQLDGAIARRLAEPAVAAGGVGVATVLKVPGTEAELAPIRALDFAGEVGMSAWNGFVVARLCARDGSVLRRDLITLLSAMGDRALPRLWLN